MKDQILAGDFKKKFTAYIGLAVVSYVLVSSYILRTVSIAETRHFWIDELLAVWAARLPTSSDVISAIWQGSEYSPPTYNLFLHFLFEAFGFSPLVARLPSIIGVLLTAILIASIVWRSLGILSAVLTLGLILNSSLFNYAFQARNYGLLMMVLSTALLLWSLCKAESRNWWQAASISLLLFSSVSLHFYGIIAFAIFAVIEAIWSFTHRHLRPEIWLAFIAAAAASTVWLPLMQHLAGFNNEDIKAPEFYGAPTLTHLTEHIQVLFYQSKAFSLFILSAVILIGSAYSAAAIFQPRDLGKPETSRAPNPIQQDILIIGIALTTALPIGFALALVVTHVFSPRYALMTSIGCILLFMIALRNIPYRNAVGGFLLIPLCVLPLLHEAPEDMSQEALRLIDNLQWPGPIAVTEGNLYMELMESADPATRSRLIYLTRPEGVTDDDSTSERLVKRVTDSMRPDFVSQAALSFMAQNHTFACLSRPSSPTDGLGVWMIKQGYVTGIFGFNYKMILSKMDVGTR